jgi:hypothetical protein
LTWILVDETGKLEGWVIECLFWEYDETNEFEVLEVKENSEISNNLWTLVKSLIGKGRKH